MSCLTCPDAANLGDVALQLQETALEAEACIFEQERLLRSAVNRPTVIITSTATYSVVINVETSLPTQGSPTIIFNNANTLADGLAWTNFFLQGGVFLCGATYNATASTPTDNTLRRTGIGVHRTTDASTQFSQSTVFTQYETTAGNGVDVSVMGVFAVEPNTFLGNVTLFHNNTGSSLTIATGAFFWVTKISETLALKAV